MIMRCEYLITNNRGNKGDRAPKRMAACESSRQIVFEPLLSIRLQIGMDTPRSVWCFELPCRLNQIPYPALSPIYRCYRGCINLK